MARTKMKWLKMRKKTEPELPYEPPVWMGPISNGEFYKPVTERDRKMRAEILRRADDYSRRIGMDRREFMASSMGMATTLAVFNLASGCGDSNGLMGGNAAGDFAAPRGGAGTSAGAAQAMGAAGKPSGSPLAGTGAGPIMAPGGGGQSMGPPPVTGGGGNPAAGMAGDGGMMVSQEMCMSTEMADRLFKKDYFILDMQTHHLGTGNLNFLPSGVTDCGMPGSNEGAYIRSIFMDSETTVAVLSGLPSDVTAGGDLSGFSNMQMVTSRDRINKGFAPGEDRMLAHCQTNPYDGPDLNGPMMERFYSMHDTRGWKCYPPVGNGSTGWFLTDPNARAFIDKAVELGEPLICAHKGFPLQPSWSRTHANPIPDVGVIAKEYPNVNFVIYHSAFDSAHTEGPYEENPNPDNGGTDRLSKAVTDAGVRGMNVYAEMGSAWFLVMRDIMQATHYVGKMLKYVGEERLVWGSECCWFASPQCQIEAMKAFKMDSGIRDMYQYPDFTDDLKAKTFGLTGARLYRIDANACRYTIDTGAIAMNKQLLDDELGPRRWVADNRPAIQNYRQLLNLWADNKAKGVIA
jgi:uncharacterized protein